MRYAIALSILITAGCTHRPDYQPPPGHPAHSGATAWAPPMAADPFTVKASPIEDAPMPHKGHDHGKQMPAKPKSQPPMHQGHEGHKPQAKPKAKMPDAEHADHDKNDKHKHHDQGGK